MYILSEIYNYLFTTYTLCTALTWSSQDIFILSEDGLILEKGVNIN